MRLARSVEPRRERTLGIGPLVIGNERIPAGPAGIAVVRIAAELTEKLVIARELVAVERDTETGRIGHGERAVAIDELAARNHVVGHVVIVRVGGVAEVCHDGTEVQHRRELDAQFARAVHGDAEPHRFADAGCLDARADAAPERRVEQDHVDGARHDVGRELLEVDDDRIRCRGQRHEFLQPRELRHAPHRILEVVVAQVEDAAAEIDRIGERERAVRVVAEAVAGQCAGKRAIAGELVRRRVDAALQLVYAKAVSGLQRTRVRDELLGDAHFAFTGLRVRVTEEQIRRELNGVANLAAEKRMHGHAELLSHDVEARELERRVQLRAIVVEARRRIADRVAHRLEPEHVVATQVAFERGECARRVLAAAAHLAQADIAVRRFDFDDRAHESTPVRAVAVQQRCLERNGNGRGADRGDRRGGHGERRAEDDRLILRLARCCSICHPERSEGSADRRRRSRMTTSRDDTGIDRRTFLKGAAAAGASVAAASTLSAANAQQGKAAAVSAGEAPEGKAEKTRPGDIVIARPGSDFMADVIKTLDLEYVAANPASSFRSLHESLVNYGGNRNPELITCMHEESAVGIAHGYAKAAGKPMMAIVHGSVGLQHASMALYNAWCDRVPIIVVAGNGADATKRRAGTEWYHSVQDCAAIVRDFVKWDDAPASLTHFAESMVRAYRIATTAPMEPVLITADIDLQEERAEEKLAIPKRSPAIQAQGERGALDEAAKLLIAAQNPVIIADRAVRSQSGVDRLVELAEAIGAPVINLGGRMNFPSRHRLCHTERRLARLDVRTISIGMSDAYVRSNYQDFQRFMPIDLPIVGDVESSLPTLIERVRASVTPERARMFEQRAQALGEAARKELARARDEAAAQWNLSPISTARLAMELWNVAKDEPWSLAVSDRIPWANRLWSTTRFHQMLGNSGAQGVGYGVAGAVGAGLANKTRGLVTVTFQPDGDLMYAPGALWTAAHHRIPVLFLMHNNRAYHQEVMHLQRMAALHDRRPDQAWIGNAIDRPAIDYAKLANAMGVWAQGPIGDPGELRPALQRAMAIVKGGEPALIDAVCQPR